MTTMIATTTFRVSFAGIVNIGSGMRDWLAVIDEVY